MNTLKRVGLIATIALFVWLVVASFILAVYVAANTPWLALGGAAAGAIIGAWIITTKAEGER